MALTYWERRAVQRVLNAQKREDAAMSVIAKAVARAQREIQEAIERIGQNFARAYDLTEDEAKGLLAQPAEREEYVRLLGEIAQLPAGEAKTRLQARAASGGYAYRISREEAMAAHVEAQAAILGVEVEKQAKATLTAVGGDTAQDVRADAVRAGFGVDTTGSNLSAVEEIMSTPWNGGDYSSRVWKNADALKQLLDDTVMSGFLSGRSPRKIAAEVADKMNVAYYQAERLVRTEVNRIQNMVALEELRRAGAKNYVWVAALDRRTCKLCGEMDGKHFSTEEAKTGETLPPRHPFCRCCITIFTEAQEGQTRFARGVEGDGIKVPAGMTHEQLAKAQAQYRQVIAYEGKVTEAVVKTADELGMAVAGFEYRVKTETSYLRKMASEFARGHYDYQASDILRYTYTASGDELADRVGAAIAAFEKMGYNTVEVKNYWLKEDSPYKGINTTVITPDGIRFEVQYHTPQSYAIKSGEMHALYEQLRLVDDPTSPEALEISAAMWEYAEQIDTPEGIAEVKKS